MTSIYLEPGVLTVRPGTDRTDEHSLVPDAAEALQTLADTGHELILIAEGGVELPAGFPHIRGERRVVDGESGWFLTTDPELCGPRQAGLQTILVGPGPGTHRAAVQRCDISSRDLRAAVLEILTREAMAPVA